MVKFLGGHGFPEIFQGHRDGEIPFFKVSDMSARGNDRVLRSANHYVSRRLASNQGWKVISPPAVAFAKVGAALLLNRRRLICTGSLIDNNMMAAVPGSSVETRWLYWWFQTVDFETFVQTGALPSVNQTQLSSLSLDVPPLPEQRLIAEILDTIDEAIRKTEAIVAKLGQVKQGLLHDLLTRGIDEHGQLRDPDRHPEQFKDSPLGRIPKEWGTVQLRDGIDFITDYRGSTPPYCNQGVPVIIAENVSDGHLRSTTKYVTYDVYRRTSTRGFPEPGDIIFTTEAPVGEVAQVPGDRPYRLTRRVLALRPKATWWRKNFLFWFVYYRARSGAWDAYMHGSTVPRILKPDILARFAVTPALAEQDRIATVLDEHEVRAGDEVRSLAKLRLLKQGLMDDLLTGRVRVTNLLQEAGK